MTDGNKNRDEARRTAPGVDQGDLPDEAEAAILRLLDEIEQLRSELETNKRRISFLETLADSDPLTPVVNRRAFLRELDRAKSYAERYGGTASMVYLDLDGMKSLNDTHGHACGDRALLVMAESLVANVRASDVVGRLGGDEFGVILARADRAAAEEKAQLLSAVIASARIDTDGGTVALSASWGVVELNGARDAADAMERADRAMYERKRARDGKAAQPR